MKPTTRTGWPFTMPEQTPSGYPNVAAAALFTQFIWETEGLSDGPYEIHAWAVCTGRCQRQTRLFRHHQRPHRPRTAQSGGRARNPPTACLNVGDEISFTFNKHINCDKLIPADITQRKTWACTMPPANSSILRSPASKIKSSLTRRSTTSFSKTASCGPNCATSRT